MNIDQTFIVYGYLVTQIPEDHIQYITNVETHFINSMRFNLKNKLESGYQRLVEKIHHKKVIFYKTLHPNDEYIEKIIIKFCPDPVIIDTMNNIDIIKSLSFVPTPVLYIVNGSVFSWRILMLCYHYNINFVTKRLKVMGPINQCQTQEFADIAPRQKTPVWVENKTQDQDQCIIYESLAIILYLANKYNLIDDAKYGTIIRLIMESENLIVQLRYYDNFLYHPERLDIDSNNANVVDVTKTRIEKYIDQELNHWSRYLGTNKYFGSLTGDGINLVDITLYPLFGWMRYKGYCIKPMHQNLIDYEIRMRSEHCVKWSRPLFWKCS